MTPSIYFSRHGQSHANVIREISNRGLVHPLTSLGRRQAAALVERLRPFAAGDAVSPITKIYSSPLLRAIETTVLVANGLNLEYEVVGALREYDCGELEDRSDADAWSRWHELFDAWAERGDYAARIPGGESFTDVRDRFVPFTEKLCHHCRETGESVLCVGHGGLYSMMLPVVVTNIDPAFFQSHPLGNTSWGVCEVRPGGLVCVAWDGVAVI